MAFSAWHFSNGGSKTKGINYDKSYIPVVHAGSFHINIAIEAMHIINSRFLYVSNAFQNMNVPIHEKVCVRPPAYYLDWFENTYHSITINSYDGPFYLQCMNGIQGTKSSGRYCKILIDTMV